MRKLNIFKKYIKRYKWLSISVLALVILIPAFVLAIGNPQEGYPAYKNAVSQPMFSIGQDDVTVEQIGFCVGNSTDNDYFVPTGRFSDISAFVNNKPSGVSLMGCVGDGQCTGSESCNNPSSDCGLCGDVTPVDACSTNCTSSCPCASNCILNCTGTDAGGGGGGGGGGGSCTSYPLFLASCG